MKRRELPGVDLLDLDHGYGIDLSESIAMYCGDIFWPANITNAAEDSRLI